MKLHLKHLLMTALCLLVVAGTVVAEETGPTAHSSPPPAATDLSGDWKVMLENSLSRKQIRFRIAEKNGRIRGKMASKEYGTQDLQGRREDNGKILIWSTLVDETGASTESSFKGQLEGEAIVGEGRFFEKPFTFRAERVEKKGSK